MFLKVCVFLLVVRVSVEQAEDQDWDLAVAIDDQIKLLTKNGTLVGATLSFTHLKALTFDNVRHQFLVSDMNQQNDTIYSISLKEQGSDYIPVVEDLSDDVQGLAIDPLGDVLYWADPRFESINSISLAKPTNTHEVFIRFKNREPRDLAIDSCRRYIYFTNSFSDSPSIDRISLDNKTHEVLINTELYTPMGIAIDYVTERVYWSNSGPGIYFTIESATLEGTEREIIVSNTHQHPFGLAVDSDYIYWTDMNNRAVWKKRKNSGTKEGGMLKMKDFDEKPRGVIAKHLGFAGTPDCNQVLELISEYNESTTEYFQKIEEKELELQKHICLNNGHQSDSGCICPRGFGGPSCEIPLCYNFCIHGRCTFSLHGYPKCICNSGYVGNRCETNICDNFCLNNATCTRKGNKPWDVECGCQKGFFGTRCEMNADDICNNFCGDQNRARDLTDIACACNENINMVKEIQNITNVLEVKSNGGLLEHFKDPTVSILSVCMLVSLCVSATLLLLVYRLRKKSKARPRVNKRIIVNKNITPLTYRPHSETHECEITIENCCNMNVCETPCFEPPQFRKKSAKDEKKKLLTNMENPDELC